MFSLQRRCVTSLLDYISLHFSILDILFFELFSTDIHMYLHYKWNVGEKCISIVIPALVYYVNFNSHIFALIPFPLYYYLSNLQTYLHLHPISIPYRCTYTHTSHHQFNLTIQTKQTDMQFKSKHLLTINHMKTEERKKTIPFAFRFYCLETAIYRTMQKKWRRNKKFL